MALIVDLEGLEQTALIVLAPTGVHYWNQVSGTACWWTSAEGFLVPIEHSYPLAEPEKSLTARLVRHFVDVRCGTGVFLGEDADVLDAMFDEDGSTRGIRVDRSRIQRRTEEREDSMEAWVYVLVDDWIARDHHRTISCSDDGPKLREAILTWRNSD